jgi:hypothetical protein
MTDAEYNAWLVDPSTIRVVLVEAQVNVGGVETARYLSTKGYVTGGGDTPDNTAYLPIISEGIKFTEKVSLDNSASMSVGDIEIYNPDGEYDGWLEDVWRNRAVVAYLGDSSWPKSDFRMIFNGVIADIDSKANDTINIKLRDKFQRLNTPISENKLGGDVTYTQSGFTVTVTKPNHGRRISTDVVTFTKTGNAVSGTYSVVSTPTVDTFTYTAGTSLTTSGTLTLLGQNSDSVIPLVFGECHNVTPLLIDAGVLEYQVCDGATERIIEVRDNGLAVGATVTLATGKFRMNQAVTGAITVSAQGKTPYVNTVATTIKKIVTEYGKASDRFTSGDVDQVNFDAFNAANPQPIGLMVNGRQNVINACQQIASSVGAQIVMSREGKLRLLRVELPAIPDSNTVVITSADIVARSLQISQRTDVVAAVKVGFNKDWTVQSGLLTNIQAKHKDSFATEWYEATAVDEAVKTKYKLDVEPIMEETLLLTAVDANTEAARRLAIYKSPRTVYSFEGVPRLLSLALGQVVTLKHPRFGLSEGKSGVVVELSPNWLTGKINVSIII